MTTNCVITSKTSLRKAYVFDENPEIHYTHKTQHIAMKRK